MIVLNVLFASHQTEQSDYYLATRLTAAVHDPPLLSQSVAAAGSSAATDDVDADSAPVFLWSVNPAGTVTAHSPGAPALPAACSPSTFRTTGSPSPPASVRRARSG